MKPVDGKNNSRSKPTISCLQFILKERKLLRIHPQILAGIFRAMCIVKTTLNIQPSSRALSEKSYHDSLVATAQFRARGANGSRVFRALFLGKILGNNTRSNAPALQQSTGSLSLDRPGNPLPIPATTTRRLLATYYTRAPLL